MIRRRRYSRKEKDSIQKFQKLKPTTKNSKPTSMKLSITLPNNARL
jgi:hypothetical protein